MQYYVNLKKPIIRLYLLILLILLILNPYTVIGRPGIVAALLLCTYALITHSYNRFFSKSLLVFSAMLSIGIWGVLISYVNNIGQFGHLTTVISLIIYTLSVEGFWRFCQNHGIDFHEIIKLCSIVVVFNSFIILLEGYFPIIRDMIESFLAPTGNINWTVGFRYRGLSGSGGAGLSIASPIALACILYLYELKKVSTLFTITSFLLILIALVNIGRTGLALLPIVLAIFFLFQLKKIIKEPSGIIKFTIVSSLIITLIYSKYELMITYFNDKFGEGFTNYAFEFILKGKEGIEAEGTVSTLASFNSVLPTGFPEAFIGYGFYGGSAFTPWTDSGYARTILSVGWILGIMFYLCFYYIYIRKIRSHFFLFYSILAVLVVSEYKEPLLYSGVGARIFVLLLVFYCCCKGNPPNK